MPLVSAYIFRSYLLEENRIFMNDTQRTDCYLGCKWYVLRYDTYNYERWRRSDSVYRWWHKNGLIGISAIYLFRKYNFLLLKSRNFYLRNEFLFKNRKIQFLSKIQFLNKIHFFCWLRLGPNFLFFCKLIDLLTF